MLRRAKETSECVWSAETVKHDLERTLQRTSRRLEGVAGALHGQGGGCAVEVEGAAASGASGGASGSGEVCVVALLISRARVVSGSKVRRKTVQLMRTKGAECRRDACLSLVQSRRELESLCRVSVGSQNATQGLRAVVAPVRGARGACTASCLCSHRLHRPAWQTAPGRARLGLLW